MPLAPSSHASFIARVGNPAGRQQTEAGAASSPRATLVRTYVRARARGVTECSRRRGLLGAGTGLVVYYTRLGAAHTQPRKA